MANISKFQHRKASNVFSLDDGTKEITVVNPYGQVICKLHFRPGDVSIYDRYKALMDDFDSIMQPMADIGVNNDGTANSDAEWAVLKQVEDEIKKRINALLDSNDADGLFATRSPFSSVNGVFYVENVLTVLGKIIAQTITEESKMSQDRVKKHLADLGKDVTVDAGATTDKS